MILLGMCDSSYTRRVAIAMALYGIGFEHRAWSVGRDFDRDKAMDVFRSRYSPFSAPTPQATPA